MRLLQILEKIVSMRYFIVTGYADCVEPGYLRHLVDLALSANLKAGMKACGLAMYDSRTKDHASPGR